MPNLITKAFSKFDIFGSEVGLNFQKDNVFKTTFGGFMSLGFVAFIGIFFWGSNVSANILKQFNDDPERIDLNSKNFMFAVKIDHDNFLKTPIFNLTLETRDYVTFPNGTKAKYKYPIQLEPCRIDHWINLPSYGKNWTAYFNKFNFKTYLCPRVNEEFIIGGNYNSEHFYHWKITVSKCQNTTYAEDKLWKPVCQTDKQVTDYFKNNQNVRLQFFTSNFIINPLKSSDFIDGFVEESIFFSVQNNGAYQTADIYFTENRIETDQSILPFQNIENEKLLTFQSGNYRTQYVIGSNGTIYGDFFIRKDPFLYTTTRYFQKVSQIISYIGGFSQIFILITAILVNYYNEYIYAVTLANKVYDFQFANKKKLDQQQKRQKLEKIQQLKGIGNKSTAEPDKSKSKTQIILDKKQSDQLPISQDIENKKVSLSNPNIEDNRVNTKEEEGVMPLDKLKQIIQQRKQQIELSQQQQQQQKKKINLSVKLAQQPTIEQIVEEDQKYFKSVKQQDINEKDKESNKEAISDIDIIRFEDDSMEDKSSSNDQGIQVENEDVRIEYKDENFTPKTSLTGKNTLIQQQSDDIHNKYIIEQQTLPNIQTMLNTIQNNIQSTQQLDTETNMQHENNHQTQFDKNNKFQNLTLNRVKSINQSAESPKNKFFSQNNLILQGLGFKDQKQFLSREFENLLKKDTTIQMTYKFFLYKLTCGKFFKTEQVLLLDKANQQMKKDLDIFMIVNRLKELEKLKVLFLDKNQETLFNFFPKPVISVNDNEETLSRAEIQEQFKNRNDSLGNNVQKDIKIKGKTQKKLNIGFKTAVLVSKAISKFKKPISSKIDAYDNVVAYQKLYEAFEKIKASGETSQFNKKLIEQLGDELNKIFEISLMIANKAGVAQGKLKDSIQMCTSERNLTLHTPVHTQRNQSIFKQYGNQQEQTQVDLNTKRNLFFDETTNIQTTERKI